MAVGLTPQHQEELLLEELTPEQFLAVALEAATKLDWNISYVSPTGFIAYTKFSMSSFSEEVKLKMEDGKATLNSKCTGSQMIDWGKNKKNVNAFITAFSEIKSSVSIQDLEQKAEELKTALASNENEQDILTLPPATFKDNVAEFFSMFKPAEGYFVTPIIVNLNIIIFIIMVACGVHIMEPTSESLLKWGANFRPSTLSGEWWRLLTNCFLHIGVIHLLMNMYALIYIDLLLEPFLGKTRFLSAYLLTGILASVASLWWHDLTVSAGASGAIFGMYGVFLAMLTTNLIEKSARQALLTSIGIFVVYNLAYGLKGGIDNAAHIGGLVSGLVIGYLFIISLKKPEASSLKYATILLPALLTLGITAAAYKYISNDIGIYDIKMKAFAEMEDKALLAYKVPQDGPPEQVAIAFRDSGLYYWNQNLALLNEVEKLNLPEVYRNRNSLLIKYTQLRIGSYKVIATAYQENTNKYDQDITDYNTRIQTVLDSLNTQ